MLPKTRTEYVANRIRERILTGVIKDGSPIRQEAIAEEFGVSRIPVREALLLLKSEGLVEFSPYRGAYATELAPEKIKELFHLRLLIERDVLAQAIPLMTESELSKAEDILKDYDEALNTSQNVEEWSTYNLAYHMALYRAAKRPESFNLIELLHMQCDRYVRMQLLYSQQIPKAVQEHHDLLDLCRAKNIKAALALLEKHIKEASSNIIDIINSQKHKV